MSIYEKISDNLYRLNGNLSVRFNVLLNMKDANNNKRYFAQIYEYSSSKYSTVSNLRTINRDYSYYISFKDYKNKEIQTILKEEHVYLLRTGLEKVLLWFTDKQYSNLFKKDHNILKLNSSVPYDPIDVLCAYGNTLKFEPAVVHNYMRDENLGVRITINNIYEHNIEINQIYGLYEVLRNLSMPVYAATILNSLDMDLTKVHRMGGDLPFGNRQPKPSYDNAGETTVNQVRKQVKNVFEL